MIEYAGYLSQSDYYMTVKKKKKKKKPNIVTDYLIYLIMRIAAMFINMMPPDASTALAKWLGGGLYEIYGRGKKRARENLKNSFPEKDDIWIEQTAKAAMEHIVMLAFDVLKSGRFITPGTWHKYIILDDMAEALEVILDGQGAILVTGHYGNFEVLGYALAVFGLESYSVARPIDNRFVNKYLMGVREARGQKIIDKKGATDLIVDILEENSLLGFIADQDAGKKGTFVDFFGRKASTYKSIGLLAMQFNLPVIVGYCRRIDNRYKFKIGIQKIIYPHQWQDQDKPLPWITAEYTSAIEDFIREAPEQYWWVHRRWKSRPKEERNRNKAAK